MRISNVDINTRNNCGFKIRVISHDYILDSNIFNSSFIWFERHCFKWFFNINSHPC